MRNRMGRIALAAACSAPSAALAAVTWTGLGGNSNFSNPGNWTPAPPAASEAISFGAAVANTVVMDTSATVGTLTFPDFTNYTFNGAHTITLDGNVINSGGGSITFNAPLFLNAPNRRFESQGTQAVTISSLASTSSRATFAGGRFILNGNTNSNFGAEILGATVTLPSPSNQAFVIGVNGQPSRLGRGDIKLNGGELRIAPAPGGSIGDIARPVQFGSAGGLLDYGARVKGHVTLNSGAADATPAVVRHSTLASVADGWDIEGNSLQTDGFTGTGATRLELSSGALFLANSNSVNIPGLLIIRGHTDGDWTAGSLATNTARFAFSGFGPIKTHTLARPLEIENVVQISCTSGPNTIDSPGGLTMIVRPGARVGVQGRSTGANTFSNFAIGANTNRTVLVEENGLLSLDVRYRSTSTFTAFTGGVTMNAATILKPGATLSLTQSFVDAGQVGFVQFNGNIIGEGSNDNNAVLDLRLPLKSVNGGQLGGVNYSSSMRLIINGQGIGGLRVTGDAGFINDFITPARLGQLTGSGGYLAFNQSSPGVINLEDGEWTAPVGLRIGTGTDLQLADSLATITFSRPIHIEGSLLVKDDILEGRISGNGGILDLGPSLFPRINGVLSPGGSAGGLGAIGNLFVSSFNLGGAIDIEIAGPGAGSFDHLLVSRGSINTNTAELNVSLLNGYAPPLGQSFPIFRNFGTSTLSGHFAGLPDGAQFDAAGRLWRINYNVNSGDGTANDILLTVVPEPGGAAVLLIGMTVLGMRRRSATLAKAQKLH